MIKIAYAPIYKYSLPEGHRFPMEKYELLPEQLLYEGTISNEQFFEPERLHEEVLLWTHERGYWDDLVQEKLAPKAAKKIGFPMSRSLVDRGLHIAQGTLDCARYAMQYGCAMNIAGGTHHAYAAHGEGFCVFNDIAIASNYLLRMNQVKQILVVDLDVHQGNGTAHIFQDNPAVFTFSVHGAKNYPHRKEKSDLDIPMPDGTQDDEYLAVLQNTLPKLIERVKPDIVFYLSGVDVIESDRLGRLSLSISGCRNRDKIVFSLLNKLQIPVAVSMGGGYSPDIRHIIEAHANTYRVAMDIWG